jgi:hypothetical protein
MRISGPAPRFEARALFRSGTIGRSPIGRIHAEDAFRKPFDGGKAEKDA